MTVVGRLAPTPSGALHPGNVTAFAGAWLSARRAGGRLLLRMEDVDRPRARPDVEQQIRDDLGWLGLTTDAETPRQSARSYAWALERLAPHTYRCRCTRRDVAAHGGVYPGTCRDLGLEDGALRFRLPPGEVRFVDRRFGPRAVDPGTLGDPVLVRSDGLVGYNLAVVADDVADGVTEVVRGADLLDQTAVQVLLWRALGATPPTWMHTPLVLGPDGRKLSKSHGSLEIRALRAAGWTPEDVWRLVLPWLGVDGVDHVRDAVDLFDRAAGPLGPVTLSVSPPAAPRPR
jgi:glutamyl/glutaminyl-tRNA synthetase